MNAKFLAVSFLSATRLDDVSLSGDAIHSFQLVDCRKSRLFSISASKTALYLAVSQKDLHPARKMALYLAVSQKGLLPARNTGFFMAVIGKGRLGRPYGLACAACFEEPAGVFAAPSPAPCIHLHELFTCRQQIGRFFDFVCQFCCQWVISAYCRQ